MRVLYENSQFSDIKVLHTANKTTIRSVNRLRGGYLRQFDFDGNQWFPMSFCRFRLGKILRIA